MLQFKNLEKRLQEIQKLLYLSGIDAKAAVGIFINAIGSLKKNEIIEIQEIDENNKPIGEVIKPMDNTSIVPTGR